MQKREGSICRNLDYFAPREGGQDDWKRGQHCWNKHDPNGGYAACGRTFDSLSQNDVGCFLHLNDSGQLVSSFLLPQDVQGSFSPTLRMTKDSCYLITNTLIGGSMSRTSEVYIIDRQNNLVVSNIYTARDHSFNALNVDESNNHLCGTFSSRSAAFSTVSKADRNGGLIATYTGVTDTVFGGSIVLDSRVGEGKGNQNYFGTNVSPFILNNSVGYLVKLDSLLNPSWTKVLDFGFNSNIDAIATTADSGAVILCTVYDGSYSKISIYKVNINGDSLWTNDFVGNGIAQGSTIRNCSDGGFIISGTTMDSARTTSFAYLIKTNKYGEILPNTQMTIAGSTEFCQGDSVTLSLQIGNNYLWSNGDTASYTIIKNSGLYYATITDSNGHQSNTDSILVIVHSTPLVPVIFELGGILYTDTTVGNFSYQWFFNNVPLVNSDSSHLLPIADGDYSVQVIDTFGCPSVSALYPFLSTYSLEMARDENFYYPNPAIDFLFFTSGKKMKYIEIYNILGKLELQEEISVEGCINIDSLSRNKAYRIILIDEEGKKVNSGMFIKI